MTSGLGIPNFTAFSVTCVAQSLTFNQLILFRQFGRESKVTLEYWWDTCGIDDGASTSSMDNTKATRIGPAQSQDDGSLCLALQKLLSIAKHNYGASKVQLSLTALNKFFVR